MTSATPARKSVRPNAVVQSSVPFGDANAAICSAYRRCASLTAGLSSRRCPPGVEKSSVASSRNAGRSPRTPCWNCSMVASSSPPSGSSSLS
ncbi:hypothetical protein [Geodermatophilus sp. SYSU D00698]